MTKTPRNLVTCLSRIAIECQLAVAHPRPMAGGSSHWLSNTGTGFPWTNPRRERCGSHIPLSKGLLPVAVRSSDVG